MIASTIGVRSTAPPVAAARRPGLALGAGVAFPKAGKGDEGSGDPPSPSVAGGAADAGDELPGPPGLDGAGERTIEADAVGDAPGPDVDPAVPRGVDPGAGVAVEMAGIPK